ncbi:hypothetical protein [Bradyrhizobium sp. CCBAU 11445]|uniref:hypothetical protein n=1 Tax=Bradyrhizobium sp. CCBAU 11445 TaxID=1630896 RepID=UPI002306BA84|nr:hypothetical protein [Bradyrhizobium sp. CCBAU 11445]
MGDSGVHGDHELASASFCPAPVRIAAFAIQDSRFLKQRYSQPVTVELRLTVSQKLRTSGSFGQAPVVAMRAHGGFLVARHICCNLKLINEIDEKSCPLFRQRSLGLERKPPIFQ